MSKITDNDKINFTFRDNAACSLNKALEIYFDNSQNEIQRLKYTTILLCHSIELLFKLMITEIHPKLIYKGVYTKAFNKNKDPKTISFDDSCIFLSNCFNINIDNKIKRLKDLRNQFMHSEYSYRKKSVNVNILSILKECRDICSERNLDLGGLVDKKYRAQLMHSVFEFENQLKKAEQLCDDISIPIYKDNYNECYCENKINFCSECGQKTLVLHEELNNRFHYRCTFCDGQEDAHECQNCSNIFPESVLSIWNNDNHQISYMCDRCQSELS